MIAERKKGYSDEEIARVLKLRDGEGLDFPTIGERLGRSRSSAGVAYNRAKIEQLGRALVVLFRVAMQEPGTPYGADAEAFLLELAGVEPLPRDHDRHNECALTCSGCWERLFRAAQNLRVADESILRDLVRGDEHAG